MTVRVGVIGTGWWASHFHVPALRELESARVVAFADTDRDRLDAAAERFGIELRFTDPAKLIESGRVDAVIIAVPHAFHFEIASAAIDAGLHVLVEKPLTLSSRDAWDLVSRAETNGVVLVVGCTFQFTSSALRVRDVIQRGEIGEILAVSGLFASMVEAYYRGVPTEYAAALGFVGGIPPKATTYSDPALSGGGQAQAQLSHAMGMVLWATGRRVDEVFAYMANPGLPVDLVDAMSFRLDNGAVGTMASTGSLAPGQAQQQELRYYGTDGFVLQDLRDGHVEIHRVGKEIETLPTLAATEVYPAHAPAQSLVRLALGVGENLADGAAGARTVEFLEASYRSVSTGAPVRVTDL